jgi:hypothetical protein
MSNDPAPGDDHTGWQTPSQYPGTYAGPGQPYGGYGQPPPPGWGPPSAAGSIPAGTGPGGVGPTEPPRGLFPTLLDTAFHSYATPVIIKVLYVLGLVVIGLSYVGLVVAGFSQGLVVGFAAVLIGGVVALFYVMLFRVSLEFFAAVVRVAEDVRALRNRQ